MDEARHVHCECDWITAEDMAIFAYRQKHREEIASLRAKLEKANDLITLYVMKGPHDDECHPSEFRHTEGCKMRKRALADYKSIK